MIKRFFSFYRLQGLAIILGFFYLMILIPTADDLIIGFVPNLIALSSLTILILGVNAEAIVVNWGYIWSGDFTKQPDMYLSKDMRRLKKSKLGEDTPLFVAVKDKYYYRTDNYN